MSAEYADTTFSQIKDIISRLQSPVQDLHSLLSLLAAPLASIKILPPQFVTHNVSPSPALALSISKHFPPLQRALLQYILPTWEAALLDENSYSIVQQYFCPDLIFFSTADVTEIAILAYSTILSLPLTEYSARLLAQLTKTYPVDVLWSVVVQGKRRDADTQMVTWEDCIRNVCAVPGKAANAFGTKGNMPRELEHARYFSNVCKRCELLISSISGTSTENELSSINYLFTKLVNIGIFPSSIPSAPSQPSFFHSTLPTIRARLQTSLYASSWRKILGSLPSVSTLQTILVSLFSHLEQVPDLDGTPATRAMVKREAIFLCGMLGRPRRDSDVIDGVLAAILGRQWSVGHARVFSCWAVGAERGRADTEGLELLLDKVVELWTTPDHIRHSLLGHHQYLTAFLLLIISYLTSPAATQSSLTPITKLAFSPPFITSISSYLTHLDQSVRRCGMLVAEEVARGSGKTLNFGGWDGQAEGDGDGRLFCRKIRELTRQRDADCEEDLAVIELEPENLQDFVQEIISPASTTATETRRTSSRKPTITTLPSGYDSDDSLTGYISSPSSSRSPSPTPSELAEIEKDPTLNVTKTKVVRPVYLAQLGEMVRPTSGVKAEEGPEEVTKIEVALGVAEELIRKKRAYGTELEENAVNLVYGFVTLQDNFDIGGFSVKRQAALNALVACCPRKVAPAIIGEFFKNQYSTDQRFVMLSALALGARELASSPMPPSTVQAQRIAFPSKRLPPALHNKYLAAGDQPRTANPVQNLLEGISREAIDKSKEAAADKVPELVRERQLRIKRPTKIYEVTSSSTGSLNRTMESMQLRPQPVVAFTEVAAEYFICPLVNRFWLFLRDEQSREARTAYQPAMHRYRGAGTGLILNALVLSQFLATLAVLVHTARNAKEWLAIIAPEALELAVTLGTQPVSQDEGLNEDEDEDEQNPERRAQKEAAVLTSSLELALIVVDGCLDLDGGRSICLEHTALLLGAGEWGTEVLTRIEKGAKVLGGGGIHEMKLSRAAAGLVLKIDELTSRWRRSMVDIGL